MSYDPMQELADPARPSARVVLLVIGVICLWFAPLFILNAIYMFWYSTMSSADAQALYAELSTGGSRFGARIALLSFWVHTLVLAAVLRIIHNRSLLSLIGPLPQAISDAMRVMIWVLPLYLVLAWLGDPQGLQVQRQMETGVWLTMLPVSLVLVFVQTSSEEFIFRGYLQSQLAAISANPLVWMAIPALMFSLLHIGNGQSTAAMIGYVYLTFLSGILWVDLTARTGNLGAALALHFINNVFALLVLAYDDWLYGLSLFTVQLGGAAWQPSFVMDTLFLLCTWLAARVALRV